MTTQDPAASVQQEIDIYRQKQNIARRVVEHHGSESDEALVASNAVLCHFRDMSEAAKEAVRAEDRVSDGAA